MGKPQISLDIYLTPTPETMDEVAAMLENEPRSPEEAARLAGLLTAQMSVRGFGLWWDGRPRFSMTMATAPDTAEQLANTLRGIGLKPRLTRYRDCSAVNLWDEDVVRVMKLGGHPMGPNVAMVQRTIMDFSRAKNKAEAAAILEDARKMIEQLGWQSPWKSQVNP